MEKTKRIFWIVIGLLSLAIGAVGAVLPFLPTFPFLMLTLFSFAKSSNRLHTWFIETKLYKNNLETYITKKAMTIKTKIVILTSVTAVMGFGFVMMSRVPAARVVLAAIWAFHVIYFLFGVKTCGAKNLRRSVNTIKLINRILIVSVVLTMATGFLIRPMQSAVIVLVLHKLGAVVIVIASIAHLVQHRKKGKNKNVSQTFVEGV